MISFSFLPAALPSDSTLAVIHIQLNTSSNMFFVFHNSFFKYRGIDKKENNLLNGFPFDLFFCIMLLIRLGLRSMRELWKYSKIIMVGDLLPRLALSALIIIERSEACVVNKWNEKYEIFSNQLIRRMLIVVKPRGKKREQNFSFLINVWNIFCELIVNIWMCFNWEFYHMLTSTPN